jgi:lipid II:glycine glycyltransferase (peptidoglycan interpeptide bridge formation enzyme)
VTIVVRELGEAEREYWNAEVQRFACAHPLNAFEWGMVRSVDGWAPVYLCAERDGKFCGGMMILAKRLPFTQFTILYSQKMPVWDYDDDDALAALIDAAVRIGKRDDAIFLRVNPNITEVLTEGQKDKFVALGFKHLQQRWSFWNSPRDVARIDLTMIDSPKQYYDRLPKTTRASVRKSRRNGVTIEPAASKTELQGFYEMFRQFSIERNFMVRDYAYQERLWDTYLRQRMGRMLVAKYHGKIVGGTIDIAFAGKCLGMHGGSLSEYRGLGIDDALNVEGIQWAKENGCSWYSFRGVGTTPSQEAFKRKFMIEVVPLAGYYDLAFKPVLYRLFYWAEFTLLPLSWPVIIRARKLSDRVMRRLAAIDRATSKRK